MQQQTFVLEPPSSTLRTLFLRAGIKQGRKRLILATAVHEKEQLCDRREIA